MDSYIKQLLENSAKHERILTDVEFDTLTMRDLIKLRVDTPYHFDHFDPQLIDTVYYNVASIKLCFDNRDGRDYVFKGNVIRELRLSVDANNVLSMTVKDFASQFAYQAVIIDGLVIASHSYQTTTNITDNEMRFSQELAIRARSLARQ